MSTNDLRKPTWLRAKLPTSPRYKAVREIVESHDLHTVCQSAQCPNMGECWSRGTATVMILGNICTRSCTFCAVLTGRPTELDLGEPARVADAVAKMGLRHAVITSVARDDLKDGGASVWAATIRAIRYRNPNTSIEVLIPDLRGKEDSLDTILDAKPDILNHNLETVERLQRPIRKTASYDRTLWVLD
ncbi:MAG TPA: lipoyl synthase, partial [Opitutales bacterium]|nr:lipoyl synthase [Opitutales bacterium]